jgi:hypothetical protein
VGGDAPAINQDQRDAEAQAFIAMSAWVIVLSFNLAGRTSVNILCMSIAG